METIIRVTGRELHGISYQARPYRDAALSLFQWVRGTGRQYAGAEGRRPGRRAKES